MRRGDGKTKKFTIGVLKLPTEVTHYIVPSKEPAAYLQAKVCLFSCCEAGNRKPAKNTV